MAQTVRYPLLFQPIFKRKLWGGRHLETVLGKELPPSVQIGESWEISGHPKETSVVREGPMAGKTLRELLGTELLGPRFASAKRFPLLLKYLDACDFLSIQVHPSDELAKRFGETDPGKHEAFYVLWAEAGAKLLRGVKPGVTRDDFAMATRENRVEECVNWVPLAAGDVIPIPPGTLHTVGGGVLLAEIEQTSDCTYRVFDWNRLGSDGKPREIHMEKALEAIDFSPATRGPDKVEPRLLKENGYQQFLLYACDKFVMELFEIPAGSKVDQWRDVFSTYMVLEGLARFVHGGCSVQADKGDSVLMPAAIGHFQIRAPDKSPLRILKAAPPK